MKTLQASEGHYLTQSADIEPQNRVYAEIVNIAVNGNESDWRDADQSEYDAWKAKYDAEVVAEQEEK